MSKVAERARAEVGAETNGAGPRLPLQQAVTTLPALVAIVAGLLYATGALVRTAELREAGMTVRDTITLVPIEQHLSRGIAVALAPNTLIIVLVALLLGVVAHFLVKKEVKRARPRDTSRRQLAAALVVGIVALGIGIVLRPLGFLAVALGVSAAVWVIAAMSGPEWTRTPRPASLIPAVFTALGVMSVFFAMIDPQPLPQIRATISGAQKIRGGLIAHHGSKYYVATRNDRYTVVTDDQLASSPQIRSRHLSQDEKRTEQSLFELID